MFQKTVYMFMISILSLIYYILSVYVLNGELFQVLGVIGLLCFICSSGIVFFNTFKFFISTMGTVEKDDINSSENQSVR